MEQVQYEKLSSEYHRLADRQRFHISSRDMIGVEQEELERDQLQCGTKLHRLSCARQQAVVESERADLEEIRQRLDVCRRKNEDLAPERDCRGNVLK